MKIRGYAIPWNRAGMIEGVRETIAPNAIDIDTVRNMKLQLATHHAEEKPIAQTRNGSLTLFHDDYGLGFEADLANAATSIFGIGDINAIAHGGMNQASVLFSLPWKSHDDLVAKSRHITNAAIEHITICATAVYGEDTAAWIVEDDDRGLYDVDRLPKAIRAHADHWHRSSHRLANTERKRVSLPASSARPVSREVHRPRLLASASAVDPMAHWPTWWATVGSPAMAAMRRGRP